MAAAAGGVKGEVKYIFSCPFLSAAGWWCEQNRKLAVRTGVFT